MPHHSSFSKRCGIGRLRRQAISEGIGGKACSDSHFRRQDPGVVQTSIYISASMGIEDHGVSGYRFKMTATADSRKDYLTPHPLHPKSMDSNIPSGGCNPSRSLRSHPVMPEPLRIQRIFRPVIDPFYHLQEGPGSPTGVFLLSPVYPVQTFLKLCHSCFPVLSPQIYFSHERSRLIRVLNHCRIIITSKMTATSVAHRSHSLKSYVVSGQPSHASHGALLNLSYSLSWNVLEITSLCCSGVREMNLTA